MVRLIDMALLSLLLRHAVSSCHSHARSRPWLREPEVPGCAAAGEHVRQQRWSIQPDTPRTTLDTTLGAKTTQQWSVASRPTSCSPAAGESASATTDPETH
jgi:hypothetical protein